MVSSGTGIQSLITTAHLVLKIAPGVGVASIILAIITGVLLSIIAVLGAEYFIPLYQLEAQAGQYAQEYLFISGALTFNVTIGVVTTILRSHGYSKSPMVITWLPVLSTAR